MTAEGNPGRPTHLTLVVAGDSGHRFAVPNVWRRDAARFVAALAADRSG